VRPLARLSILDNVMVGALARTFRPSVARAAAVEQLRVVRLDHDPRRPAGSLPIGDRKKLEVARALATRPELLLLDEVMGGLNATESEEIIQLLLELSRGGLTMMIIEHDMKVIMRICERIVVLSSGRKLAEGSPPEIAAHPEVIAAYLGERSD
jgi:branched-chain amino acid transport system ATP-binding protein